MELQQINITYQQHEDRLLIRLSFGSAENNAETQEIAMSFTRRMTMMFWPKLIEAMNRQLVLQQPQAAHASSEMVAMEHQIAVQQTKQSGGFSSDYEAAKKQVTHPLGKTALLPEQVDITLRKEKAIELKFVFENHPGFRINLAKTVLHGFCKLMQAAVERADWGFILEIPGANSNAENEHQLPN